MTLRRVDPLRLLDYPAAVEMNLHYPGPTPRKCNKKADRDRISDLPSNVIDIILSKLPIKELVRTSILSRKWRYVCNSVPTLEFYDGFSENYEFPIDIINDVLLLHDGPVYKFTFKIPTCSNMRIGSLNTWIQFLSRRGLNDLSLVNDKSDPYQMPPHVFSCRDLTKLHLENFELSLPANFYGFKSLIELHLYHNIVESSALESLISSCPCVEQLTLEGYYPFECINVSAPNVKELWINQVSDVRPLCLKNVKNLINLTLYDDDMFEENLERYKVLFDLMMIEGLPKLERLYLGGSYIKIFSRQSIPQTLKSSINSLKYLELDGVNFNETDSLLLIICILESSPNLVELIVESYSTDLGLHTNYLNEIECNSCCLSQLKTVNMRVETANELSLALTRFLLANASSLETLKFEGKVRRYVPDDPYAPDDLLVFTQELLRMERASQRAKVEFLPLKL